jgi:hypothetical protein
MRNTLLALAPALLFAACTPIDSYEVKINLDPATAEAALPSLVGAVKVLPRDSVYYLIDPTPNTDRTIVRARRDSKMKTDLDVKIRDINNAAAAMLTDPNPAFDELECEYDLGLTGPAKLSCDIKTKFSDDTESLDGPTTLSRLDEQQLRLLSLGTDQETSTLTACPAIATKIYKEVPLLDGCDEVTVEVWALAAGPLYELSCKTKTPALALASLQAAIVAGGSSPAADQEGKTSHALAQCVQ